MASITKLIFPCLQLFTLSLLLVSCRSTPEPTGDTLVSVSWVNTTPHAISYIQTTLCNSATASLEDLPGYSEVPVETRQSLTRNCRVETKMVQNGETVPLGTGWLEPPVRKSKTREYNLRIHLQPGTPPQLRLEPVQNLRARMHVGRKKD
jgi:hypothetical protein